MAKILLAEDDQSMLGFLTKALENAGHKVTASKDGLEALDHLLQGENFDLLLTDIVMPGIDGIELSQKASTIAPNMKVMFITGFAGMTKDRDEPAPQDAKVMSKPFHLNDLVKQVDTLLTA